MPVTESAERGAESVGLALPRRSRTLRLLDLGVTRARISHGRNSWSQDAHSDFPQQHCAHRQGVQQSRGAVGDRAGAGSLGTGPRLTAVCPSTWPRRRPRPPRVPAPLGPHAHLTSVTQRTCEVLSTGGDSGQGSPTTGPGLHSQEGAELVPAPRTSCPTFNSQAVTTLWGAPAWAWLPGCSHRQ